MKAKFKCLNVAKLWYELLKLYNITSQTLKRYFKIMIEGKIYWIKRMAFHFTSTNVRPSLKCAFSEDIMAIEISLWYLLVIFIEKLPNFFRFARESLPYKGHICSHCYWEISKRISVQIIVSSNKQLKFLLHFYQLKRNCKSFWVF